MLHDTYFYRPPTKLQEGYVFSHVCLFTGVGPHVTITHDALDLTVQAYPLPAHPRTSDMESCLVPAPPGHRTLDSYGPNPLASGILWPSL